MVETVILDLGAVVPDLGIVIPDFEAVIPDLGAVIPDLGIVIPDLIRDPAPLEHWIAGQARNDNMAWHPVRLVVSSGIIFNQRVKNRLGLTQTMPKVQARATSSH